MLFESFKQLVLGFGSTLLGVGASYVCQVVRNL